MVTVTYVGFDDVPHSLTVGRNYAIDREGDSLDIWLVRDVAIDCPLRVSLLIRTTGEVVLWSTEWKAESTNTYWHFGAAKAPARPPTDGQLATLERMFLGVVELPGNLGSCLGQPVAAWAFAGLTPGQIAQKHDRPTPVMSGGEP